jgi:Domain of unknown function (DUF4145)
VRLVAQSYDHPAFGAFTDLPLPIPGELMRCPSCGESTPDDLWKTLVKEQPKVTDVGEVSLREVPSILHAPDGAWVQVQWIKCANSKCGEIVVRVSEIRRRFFKGSPVAVHQDSWLARPRFGEVERPIDPLVPEPFKGDYAEAAALLDISPRMSAVLSRSILADLLAEYAELKDFKLSDRIDRFRENTAHPADLRKNIHHFREIADFGAHTQKNDQDIVIEVSHNDAEWMLGFLDRMFTYFIVTPETDRMMREVWDKKLEEAGRKPISPPPDETT